MPHPERAIFTLSSPSFSLEKEKFIRKGQEIPKYYEPAMKVFKNAVKYFK